MFSKAIRAGIVKVRYWVYDFIPLLVITHRLPLEEAPRGYTRSVATIRRTT
jgi:hypothetical protein